MHKLTSKEASCSIYAAEPLEILKYALTEQTLVCRTYKSGGCLF